MDNNSTKKMSIVVLSLLLTFTLIIVLVMGLLNGQATTSASPSPSGFVSHDISQVNTQGTSSGNPATTNPSVSPTVDANKTTFAPVQEVTNGEKLEVHFINVGEADSIFITTGGYNMLIDAGESSSGKTVVQYLQYLGVDTIHCLVATHPDQDHIGGMDTVINRMTVNDFYMGDTFKDSKHYENLIEEATKQGITITVPKLGVENDKFSLGQAQFQIIAPLASYSNSESNNSSIVLRMTFGEKVFLFAGDIERDAENDLLLKYGSLKADVLKVPHHGRSSGTDEFIAEVKPTYSIISCLEEMITNSVVGKLRNVGSTVYVTGRDGNVVCKTDGKELSAEIIE